MVPSLPLCANDDQRAGKERTIPWRSWQVRHRRPRPLGSHHLPFPVRQNPPLPAMVKSGTGTYFSTAPSRYIQKNTNRRKYSEHLQRNRCLSPISRFQAVAPPSRRQACGHPAHTFEGETPSRQPARCRRYISYPAIVATALLTALVQRTRINGNRPVVVADRFISEISVEEGE